MHRRRLALATLLLLLVLLPLADAKGGTGGGRRTCTARDTNGDFRVSAEEQEAQCGGSDDLSMLLAGGAVVVMGGLALWGKMKGGGLGVASTSLADAPTPFARGVAFTLGGRQAVVAGWVRYKDGEGYLWLEHALDWNGTRLWLELDEGRYTLHRAWRRTATFKPPTVDGERVRVRERGLMRIVESEGLGRDDIAGDAYVDGSVGGQDISMERDGDQVLLFRSSRVTVHNLTLKPADPRILEP